MKIKIQAIKVSYKLAKKRKDRKKRDLILKRFLKMKKETKLLNY